MHTNHNNVTPSADNEDQAVGCEVTADAGASNINQHGQNQQGQTKRGSVLIAGNDSVQTIAKRPVRRASMHTPAISASKKAPTAAASDTLESLKGLLNRSAKTRIHDLVANADATFRSLLGPVDKKAADADNDAKNLPVANLTDLPSHVSLASLAAARRAQEDSQNKSEPDPEIPSTEEGV